MAAQTASTALLLIDTINAFDFPGNEGLIRGASEAAPRIRELAARARADGVPVVYVNDNFGQWRSDFHAIIATTTAESSAGRHVAELLRPAEDDYFVLKPRHSGFFSTTLELLLEHLGAGTLVLTGFATDLCVLFTAHDAHMLGYHLYVPADCTAANSPAIAARSLAHLQEALSVVTEPSDQLDFEALRGRARKPLGQAF